MLDFPSPATTGQIYQNWQFDGTKWKQLGSVTPLPITDTGRNLVTNGTFVIAQRGTGPFTASYAYTADRWRMGLDGSDTASQSIIVLTDTQRTQIGNESAQWGLQTTFTGSSVSGSDTNCYQAIEGIRRLSGKTVTISFWAWGSAALKVGVTWWQSFGTGGSPSAQVNGTGQAVTLTTTPVRYSVTVNIPSASGKTFGSNGDDATALCLMLSAATNQNAWSGSIGVQSGTVTFYGVQLEIGTQATALDAGGTPQQILAECQRFYQLVPIDWAGYVTAANGYRMGSPFTVAMRASPSVTIAVNNTSNFGTPTVGVTFGALVSASGTAAATGYGSMQLLVALSADL